MSNFINGYSYPIFRIYTLAGVLVDTIELPLTGKDGLEVRFEKKSITHEFLNFNISSYTQGRRLHYTLSYIDYTNKDTTQKIFSLLNYEDMDSTYKIFLQPRADVGAINNEVIGMNDEVILKILKGGDKAQGHSGLVLNYQTKGIQQGLKIVDPDNIAIPIDNNLIII